MKVISIVSLHDCSQHPRYNGGRLGKYKDQVIHFLLLWLSLTRSRLERLHLEVLQSPCLMVIPQYLWANPMKSHYTGKRPQTVWEQEVKVPGTNHCSYGTVTDQVGHYRNCSMNLFWCKKQRYVYPSGLIPEPHTRTSKRIRKIV